MRILHWLPARIVHRSLCLFLAVAILMSVALWTAWTATSYEEVPAAWQPGDLIKWVDFDIPSEILEKAIKIDIQSHERLEEGQPDAVAINWIELLAYMSAKYWGEFKRFRDKDLTTLRDALQDGHSMEELTADMNLYPYYLEVYNAVLGGLVGPFRQGVRTDDGVEWQDKYGLKAFSPIAQGFSFSHYDDFGVSRSYGYKRRHLGHDMLALVGTPVVAIETGVVEELGWNQYGGWRAGLRSLDGKRYYYYAHFRQNRPYRAGLEKGQLVYAGDVIGYVGRTGYSANENVNNIKQSHLHWGLQIIFDESQKEGPNEIWVDVFQITKLLQKCKSKVQRDPETKEFSRVVLFEEATKVSSGRGEAADEPVRLPIVMYHSLLKSRAGENPFIISPEQFASDLRYLHENGYHTVVVDDLIQFVRNGKPLPDKPVMLTFDDGHYNNIHYAQPLLETYGMRAVMAVVGEYVDKSTNENRQDPNFSYVSWDTLAQMQADGVFEVQSHTYHMHNNGGRRGCLRKPGESMATYEALFAADAKELADKLVDTVGHAPAALVYPFGAVTAESERVVRALGFSASMSSENGINLLTPGREDCLFKLKRNLRSDTVSLAAILNKYNERNDMSK